MTSPPPRAERVAELVETALEQPPADRPAFLRARCGDDPTLQTEVESLLGQLDGAPDFLEAPLLRIAAGELLAGAAGPGPAADPGGPGDNPEAGGGAGPGRLRAGDRLGDCRVVALVGEGGMGEVYLAEDTTLGRRVAVKVVRHGPGSLDAETLRRHFRREERILAGLNHPNIARLYGGGVTAADGAPYFVMEYVEGERLDTYCDARALSVEARLALFRQVCAAVAYAHQHLVIHRDLKPANVRVTPEGEPKLLDFGVAKLLDPQAEAATAGHEPTLTLQGVMTPDYASPEQVRGEPLTTASDVYSLGVILYELLSGHRPYRTRSRRPEEIARVVGEQVPARPSTVALRPPAGVGGGELWPTTATTATATALSRARGLASPVQLRRRLAGDLDTVVLTALRKEPGRRYATVGQLSEDLRRHLAGLPVSARGDSFGYRAGKFVRRHRAGVAAAALVLAAVGVGSTTTLVEKRRAERRFDDVRQLANALLTELAPRIERLPGSTEARRVLLAQSLKYLDRLSREAGRDAGLQGELATAYEKVGDLQGNPTNPNLAAPGEALASYEKAHALRRALVARNPRDAAQRQRLADNCRALGDVRWQANQSGPSLESSREAARLYEELLAAQPGSPELRLALGRTRLDVGQNLSSNQQRAAALAEFARARTLLEGLRRERPDSVEVLRLLGTCHGQLGNALSWEGQQAPAQEEMSQAIALYEPLTAAHPQDGVLRGGLWLVYLLTSSVYEEVDDAAANRYAFQALRLAEQTAAEDPANGRAQQQLARTCSRVGVTLDRVGRSAEAVGYLEKACALLREVSRHGAETRRFQANLALALERLGDARGRLGDPAGALVALDEAAGLFAALAGADPGDHGSRKNWALVEESRARAHERLAGATTAADRPTGADPAAARGATGPGPGDPPGRRHLALAHACYQHGFALLRELDARHALSAVDRKDLERLRAAAVAAPAPGD